jgi:hypothetical protein
MPRPSKLEPFILQAALHALEHQRERVNEQIAAIRAVLGQRPAAEAAASQRRPRRPLSAAARARIAAAQRRRWAEFRQLRQAPAEASQPRRKRGAASKRATPPQAGAEA